MRTIQASCETYLGLVYLGKELPPAQLREVRQMPSAVVLEPAVPAAE